MRVWGIFGVNRLERSEVNPGVKQVRPLQPGGKEPGPEPYSEEDLRQIHIASGINILAGIWLIAASFVLVMGSQ